MNFLVSYYNAKTGEHRHDEIVRDTTLEELQAKLSDYDVTIKEWNGPVE